MKEIVFVDKAHVGDFALKIGEAIGDERGRDPRGRQFR